MDSSTDSPAEIGRRARDDWERKHPKPADAVAVPCWECGAAAGQECKILAKYGRRSHLRREDRFSRAVATWRSRRSAAGDLAVTVTERRRGL
jgi:hypothetical protein